MPLLDAAASRGRVRLARRFEPSPAELDEVRAACGLHELAAEDVQKFPFGPRSRRMMVNSFGDPADRPLRAQSS